MAGTRTAPTIDATPTSVISTLHLVDASGDQYTDAITTLDIVTPAEFEAWAVAYQAASQASLWQGTQTWFWTGVRDGDNAEVGQRNSVKDGINLSYKNLSTLATQAPRLVAPVAATMQGNQDIPLISSAEMTALLTALAAILTGFELNSAQFTERRERSNNPRIKV